MEEELRLKKDETSLKEEGMELEIDHTAKFMDLAKLVAIA